MKELTIEQKAAAYDEAIERVENIKTGKCETKFIFTEGLFEHIFPELREKESEDDDEKIRKVLVELISTYLRGNENGKIHDVYAKDILAWLEKQAEQKPIFEMKTPEESLGIDSDTYNKIVDECIYGEQKPTDNKGMNLVEEKMTPFQKKVFCIVDTTIEEEQGLSNICNELLALAIQEIKQKSAWSEEDEEQLDRAIYMMEQLDMTNSWDDVYNWLKSLKDRVQPQPKQEWNKEDEMMLDTCIDLIEHFPRPCGEVIGPWKDCVNWLNSLKDRYTWKPSDEQIKAIDTAISQVWTKQNSEKLMSLYKDLKKLKG